jgi:hypothetical protein
VEWSGVEWSGLEWSGLEWSGVEWSGVEWSGVEWSGVEWSGVAVAVTTMRNKDLLIFFVALQFHTHLSSHTTSTRFHV